MPRDRPCTKRPYEERIQAARAARLIEVCAPTMTAGKECYHDWLRVDELTAECILIELTKPNPER